MNLDKPIYLLSHGPSIQRLEQSKDVLKDRDVYWVSFNRFDIIQKNLMDKLGKTFDIVYCSADYRYQHIRRHLVYYDGLFITNNVVNKKYELDLPENQISDLGYGRNSLTALILILIYMGFKDIHVFGADGGSDSKEFYYGGDNPYCDHIPARRKSISDDMNVMNKTFWDDVKNEHLPIVEIYNVNNTNTLPCFTWKRFEDYGL